VERAYARGRQSSAEKDLDNRTLKGFWPMILCSGIWMRTVKSRHIITPLLIHAFVCPGSVLDSVEKGDVCPHQICHLLSILIALLCSM
jgi:hypothetical protein